MLRTGLSITAITALVVVPVVVVGVAVSALLAPLLITVGGVRVAADQRARHRDRRPVR